MDSRLRGNDVSTPCLSFPRSQMDQAEDMVNKILSEFGRIDIMFLSSKTADWITGQCISVNGGYFMG